MKMKRILSSILAVATVASVMLLPTSADNGSVTQEVNVPYLSQIPTFDGVINAEEWGEKSFTVSGADAAKPGDTAPSEKNVFAWYEHEYDELEKTIINVNELDKEKTLAMTYDVWLRWDTQYLYIAAKVIDPDGYYLPSGNENIWNGDCLQFRVDPQGPNGYQKYKNSEYDYKTQGFDIQAASGVGYTPWAFGTKICNIGLGVPNLDFENDRNIQAYDMADNGTGDFTEKLRINDPKKMGPGKNPLGNDTDYTSQFYMSVTANGDGTYTNTYECAVPWTYLDQWGLGQVAVGYAWGMSIVVLNGYNDNDGSAFDSYLTWGSGICGAQQDDAWLRNTCGGSNAIILTDKDALTGEAVADLPQLQEPDVDGEVVHNIMDVTGSDAYYLGSSNEITLVDGDYELNVDIAFLGLDALADDKSYVGVWMGEGYNIAAGWDAFEKKFFIGEQQFNNGINKSIPYTKSDDEFDWQVGNWHNLGVKIVDDEVTITLDGEVVLEDYDKRYTCTADTPVYQVIMYNIGDFVYDNYNLTTGDKNYSFTFDSDDAEWNKSDMKLNSIPMFNKVVKGECKNANPDSLYNCLLHTAKNAEGKNVLKCDFCGYEEAATAYGDLNGDTNINLSDVTLLLQAIAKWDVTIDEAAADVTADGTVNLSDVTRLLQYIAKWDVTLG